MTSGIEPYFVKNEESLAAYREVCASKTAAMMLMHFMVNRTDEDGRIKASAEDLMSLVHTENRSVISHAVNVLRENKIVTSERASDKINVYTFNPDWFKFKKVD